MRRAQPAKPASSGPQEVHRYSYGSHYWLRHVSGDRWMVTGDGVPLGAPKSYEQALASLDAVAAVVAS